MFKNLNKYINIANFYSVLRVFLIPIIVYCFLSDFDLFGLKSLSIGVGIVLYIIASVSDYLDGYYARKYKMSSSFGVFLDPLADKLFNISIMFSFLFIKNIKLSFFLIGFIVFREIFITLLRMYAISKNKEMKTRRHGKVKTVVQIVAQSVVLIVLLHNSIVFDLDSFKIFFKEGLSYVDIEVNTIHGFLMSEGYPKWLLFVVEWVPNFFFTIAFYYTTKSGLLYVYDNKRLFTT